MNFGKLKIEINRVFMGLIDELRKEKTGLKGIISAHLDLITIVWYERFGF